MKKIIIFLLFSNCVFSQNTLGTYNSPFLEKHDVDISDPDKKGNFDFLIYAKSTDNLSKLVALRINKDRIQYFIEYLNKLKSNHIDWTDKAKANNIEDVQKDIDIKLEKTFMSSFLYGDWQLDYSVKLSSMFKSLPLLGYCTVIFSDKLQSSSNRFIDSKGFMFVFNSEEQFDELLNILSKENIDKYFEDKKKKEEIFKN